MKIKHLKNCARCKKNHRTLNLKKMRYPIPEADGSVTWTHWAKCPNTGDPVLFSIIEMEEEG